MNHDDSYRFFLCARCRKQVAIGRECYRGNRYCSLECAKAQRKESLRETGASYQRSERGAKQHAARQKAYRERQRQAVTHHAMQNTSTPPEDTAKTFSKDCSNEIKTTRIPQPSIVASNGLPAPILCNTCGGECPPSALVGPIRPRVPGRRIDRKK